MGRIFILNTARCVSTKLRDVLRARDHVVVEFSSTEDIERALAQRTADLVIIEAQLPDDGVHEPCSWKELALRAESIIRRHSERTDRI